MEHAVLFGWQSRETENIAYSDFVQRISLSVCRVIYCVGSVEVAEGISSPGSK